MYGVNQGAGRVNRSAPCCFGHTAVPSQLYRGLSQDSSSRLSSPCRQPARTRSHARTSCTLARYAPGAFGGAGGAFGADGGATGAPGALGVPGAADTPGAGAAAAFVSLVPHVMHSVASSSLIVRHFMHLFGALVVEDGRKHIRPDSFTVGRGHEPCGSRPLRGHPGEKTTFHALHQGLPRGAGDSIGRLAGSHAAVTSAETTDEASTCGYAVRTGPDHHQSVSAPTAHLSSHDAVSVRR